MLAAVAGYLLAIQETVLYRLLDQCLTSIKSDRLLASSPHTFLALSYQHLLPIIVFLPPTSYLSQSFSLFSRLLYRELLLHIFFFLFLLSLVVQFFFLNLYSQLVIYLCYLMLFSPLSPSSLTLYNCLLYFHFSSSVHNFFLSSFSFLSFVPHFLAVFSSAYIFISILRCIFGLFYLFLQFLTFCFSLHLIFTVISLPGLSLFASSLVNVTTQRIVALLWQLISQLSFPFLISSQFLSPSFLFVTIFFI